jgi:hypothetical protein
VPGSRFDEARNVNTSLSALGRVIAALAAGDAHIPYRDSTLTQVIDLEVVRRDRHVAHYLQRISVILLLDVCLRTPHLSPQIYVFLIDVSCAVCVLTP